MAIIYKPVKDFKEKQAYRKSLLLVLSSTYYTLRVFTKARITLLP